MVQLKPGLAYAEGVYSDISYIRSPGSTVEYKEHEDESCSGIGEGIHIMKRMRELTRT